MTYASDPGDELPAGIELPADVILEDLGVTQRRVWTKKIAFLKAFAHTGIVGDGCRACQVSRSTVQYWRDSDPWFAQAFKQAMELSTDRIEHEAIRRAVDGYEEPVLFQGQPTVITDPKTGEERYLTVRKYSDPLMALVLKGRRRELYGDKVEQTLDVKKGGVLVVPGQVLDADAWESAASEQQEKFVKKE